MQLINELYERHEIACVWFIKYMAENVSSSLLLFNIIIEENIRRSFIRKLTIRSKRGIFEFIKDRNKYHCEE